MKITYSITEEPVMDDGPSGPYIRYGVVKMEESDDKKYKRSREVAVFFNEDRALAYIDRVKGT